MKVSVFLILSVIVVACSAATQVICPDLTCVGKDKTCSVTTNNNFQAIAIAECKYGWGCSATPTSSNYTGTCVALPTNGQPCLKPGNDCAQGLDCDQTMATPTCKTPERYPGMTCSATDSCSFYNGTAASSSSANCVSGTCRSTPDGQNCTANQDQCNVLTSYCNPSGVCAPTLASGAACKLGENSCGYTQQCNPTAATGLDGKCANWYSQPSGAVCLDTIFCADGLYCTEATGTNTWGTCAAPAASTTLHKACVDDSSCAKDVEECGCNSKYGKGSVCLSTVAPKNSQKNYANYASCLIKNKCYTTDESCQIAKCKGPGCTFGNSQDAESGGSGCGGICGSGSSVVASVFMVATFAAFLLF